MAIVDDHAAGRQWLRDDLPSCPDLQPRAGRRHAMAMDMAPDVMPVDLAVPACNGIHVIRAVRERAPG